MQKERVRRTDGTPNQRGSAIRILDDYLAAPQPKEILMRRFLMGLALTVTALVAADTAEAGGSRGKSAGNSRGRSYNSRGNYSSHDSHYNYHHDYGTRFSHGYYYYGRNHDHWTHRYYWPRYGCDCYWCPSTSCWYYWCEPRCCYLPVSCIEYAPPVIQSSAAASSAAVGPTVIAPTIVTVGSGPAQGAPSDLPPLPGGPAASSSSVGGNVQGIGPMGFVPPGRP
jgi:hypothetical protein